MIRGLVIMLTGMLCVAIACDRTAPDTGADALLIVSGAQFYREAWPAAADGPRTLSAAVIATSNVGATELGASGDGESAATGFAFEIRGDIGYWVIPAGRPSLTATNNPTFDIVYSLSRAIAPGSHELIVRAVDGQKRFGPPFVSPFTVVERGVAQGQLVVSLTWDSAANLDLHVVDPNGVEIFKRNQSSYQAGPPGSPREPPGTVHDGGVLDFDSDGNCIYDGLSAENVVWSDPPPKGHYLARVDTFSLCGEPAAHWKLQVFLEGVRLGASEGVGTEADTQFNHDRGAGVLALEFDVP